MDMGTLLFVVVVTTASAVMGSSVAYEFNVGGKDGWVLNPSENYNRWAQRNRFQVNDTLFFKYPKGSDSVLIVSKQDYDTCTTQKPITKLDGGDSIFKFDRSGPVYFISGNKTSCDRGQKLVIVVLAVRNPPAKSPSPSPSPATGTGSPSPSPATGTGSPSPVPAAGPDSQSQSPPPAPAAAGPGGGADAGPGGGAAAGPGGGTGDTNSTAPPHGVASVYRPSVAVTSSVIVMLMCTVCFA